MLAVNAKKRGTHKLSLNVVRFKCHWGFGVPMGYNGKTGDD
jgi:hypothetical protein